MLVLIHVKGIKIEKSMLQGLSKNNIAIFVFCQTNKEHFHNVKLDNCNCKD